MDTKLSQNTRVIHIHVDYKISTEFLLLADYLLFKKISFHIS